jgi:hypothetical protein
MEDASQIGEMPPGAAHPLGLDPHTQSAKDQEGHLALCSDFAGEQLEAQRKAQNDCHSP